MVDHGHTFHCPAQPNPPKKHLPRAQSSEQSVVILQVTRMSSYCVVSAAPQVRGDSRGVGGGAVSPPGNRLLVKRR